MLESIRPLKNRFAKFAALEHLFLICSELSTRLKESSSEINTLLSNIIDNMKKDFADLDMDIMFTAAELLQGDTKKMVMKKLEME